MLTNASRHNYFSEQITMIAVINRARIRGTKRIFESTKEQETE